MTADTRPLVVIQTQRMGDLILTYPLLLWLSRRYPGQPVTVVAEPDFALPLAPISPAASYVSLAAADVLAGRDHAMVVNLSIRPEAARLAGALRAERRIGPVADASGVVRVLGDWQLYRASVVRLNRHNRYHWAELNALDVIPPADVAATFWPAPRRDRPGEKRSRIGIFIGASQREKRPPTAFWAGLIRELVRRDAVPVLLGGPGETELGAEIARRAAIPVSNLCGRLGLKELAVIGQEMALLVTPDTGPMHLAAWTGWRVLNVSVGPVNAHETGPYQPGHFVLRPRMSCRGCWECIRPEPVCRSRLDPARVAYVASRLARGEDGRLAGAAVPGYELLRSDRDATGLRCLQPLHASAGTDMLPDAREAVGALWRATFGWFFGLWDAAKPLAAAVRLAEVHPPLVASMRRELAALGTALGRQARQGSVPESSFAAGFAPHARPLAGFLERVLQNADGDRTSRLRCLTLLEQAASLFSQN